MEAQVQRAYEVRTTSYSAFPCLGHAFSAGATPSSCWCIPGRSRPVLARCRSHTEYSVRTEHWPLRDELRRGKKVQRIHGVRCIAGAASRRCNQRRRLVRSIIVIDVATRHGAVLRILGMHTSMSHVG